MSKLFTIIALLVIVASVWLYRFWHYDYLPPLDPEEWWGPKELKGSNDERIRAFKVKFTDEMVSDLRRRLANFRPPPPPLEGVAFQYGFNSLQLDDWRQYWSEKYNFTQRERFLNQFPQFKTNVQGLDIHFIRVKPEAPPGTAILPLLILHGWPGSVREFYELIPLLTRAEPNICFVFEVIAPSLPGFGFSDGTSRPGLGGPQIATVFNNLMRRLGHQQFYLQAGDWGGEIAADLATLYPEAVLGLHTNLPIVKHPCAIALTAFGAVFPSWVVEPQLVDSMNPFSMWVRELGYFTLQATKPDTIGIALSDSPLGLLAYLFEKFSVATNYNYVDRPDGGLEEKFFKEQLLDNVMLYWASGSSGTAARLYADGFSQVLRRWRLNVKPTSVPTWVLQAKFEILYQIPTALRFKFPNLLNVTVLHDGGHFIALEKPEELAKDVFTAVKAFRKFHEENREKTRLFIQSDRRSEQILSST